MKKITIKGTPEMMALAQEAQAVQDACNLCGVAQSFARAMKVLLHSEQCTGGYWSNGHPIVRLWVSKMEHLAGMDQNLSLYTYDAVDNLASGQDVEWEIEEG